uniref:Ig-like domain-containing protein n=2 Tax=Gadus morhua TaxID=8049 RepID=A0A8C5CYY8_GADMO
LMILLPFSNWGQISQRLAQLMTYGLLDFLHGVVWTLSFPGFVAVGTMDEVQFFHFDSNTQRIVPKPAWVNQLTRDDPDYLERETGYLVSHQQDFQGMLKTQKECPPSPVVCHATGFYPDRVVVFWRRDGQELHEQVDPGEVLPNHDGTFQVSVDLNLKAVPQEDWGRYECVVQLRGIEEISTPLDPALIRTNWGKTGWTPSLPPPLRLGVESGCCFLALRKSMITSLVLVVLRTRL